jgi:type VI secretion system protein ImpF
MARETPQRLVSSLLDRLLGDPNRGESSGLWDEGKDLAQLTLDVRRDLESLLNTRWRLRQLPREMREIRTSLVEYGIPDFTGLNMSLPVERERMRLAVERAIRQFEPRLHDVVVAIVSERHTSDRHMHLRITGVLRTDPVPERVEFDSELEPSTASVAVRQVS